MITAAVERARLQLTQTEPDPLKAQALIRRIGCTYCQAQRHGFQAYNPLVQQLAALADALQYGKLQTMLPGYDIKAAPRQVSSKMVQIANDADEALRQANVEIPLFW